MNCGRGVLVAFFVTVYLVSLQCSVVYSTLTFAPTPIQAIGNSSNPSSLHSFQNSTKYEVVKVWGSKGTNDGQFKRPHDLDFSNDEKYLYSVDRDGNRIQVFDKNGKFLFKWGILGNGSGQMHVPYGIDVDNAGNVWLADRANHRIQKFDAHGNFILKFGTKGSGPGQFDNPRHVVVDKELKYVYVADSKNNRIQKFFTNGTYVTSFGNGKPGYKPGEFNLPTTIDIDSHGDFYVTERGNERVQKIDSTGKSLLMWGSLGNGTSQFCHMEHLALDKFDNVYVNDPQSDPGCTLQPSIKKFDKFGHFITKVGTLGKEPGQLIDPEHLAIDSAGNIYVSDRGNNRIQVFKPVG
ncbi:MAG TPA: 6-bladed beta-propeller [Nitrososphaeraceae archaeon]